MAEALTQYKLMVLYMLDKVKFPLSNTQISNFVLEKDYTTYFSIQQAISELLQADLIRAESTHNNTHYHITLAGRETLSLFPDKLSYDIKKDVVVYFAEKKVELEKEIQIMADYSRTSQGYVARCQLRDCEVPLIDLSIRSTTREQAEAICQNWKRQNEEVYGYLLDLLLK